MFYHKPAKSPSPGHFPALNHRKHPRFRRLYRPKQADSGAPGPDFRTCELKHFPLPPRRPTRPFHLFWIRGWDYNQWEVNIMANLGTDLEIDWMACELIERVPGKVSGRPVVRGTRILPDAIVGSYELGETIQELREGFPALSVSQIERLIEFALAQRAQATQ
jgi:uncharacterized protein (DUF433 family)